MEKNAVLPREALWLTAKLTGPTPDSFSERCCPGRGKLGWVLGLPGPPVHPYPHQGSRGLGRPWLLRPFQKERWAEGLEGSQGGFGAKQSQDRQSMRCHPVPQLQCSQGDLVIAVSASSGHETGGSGGDCGELQTPCLMYRSEACLAPASQKW